MTIVLPYGEFEVLETDHMNDQIKNEHFWDLDMRPFLDRVPANGRAIDVGAHVGFYSGYWAATGIRTIAFEAHPAYAPLLAKNIERNKWETMILPVKAFLYSTPRWLVEQPEHETLASNTWLPAGMNVHTDAHLHRYALTLDLFDFGKIDCIKVDAQGADLHVLLGAKETIERYRPLILIEFESSLAERHGHTADDYHNWARDHRYKEVPINGHNCCFEPI